MIYHSIYIDGEYCTMIFDNGSRIITHDEGRQILDSIAN